MIWRILEVILTGCSCSVEPQTEDFEWNGALLASWGVAVHGTEEFGVAFLGGCHGVYVDILSRIG